MRSALTDEKISARLLECARELYAALAEELSAGMKKLAVPEDDPNAKARAETIRAHRKALQSVLEIEAQFLKEAERSGRLEAIDVEAAKREIYRRLDRQMAQGETGSAD